MRWAISCVKPLPGGDIHATKGLQNCRATLSEHHFLLTLRCFCSCTLCGSLAGWTEHEKAEPLTQLSPSVCKLAYNPFLLHVPVVGVASTVAVVLDVVNYSNPFNSGSPTITDHVAAVPIGLRGPSVRQRKSDHHDPPPMPHFRRAGPSGPRNHRTQQDTCGKPRGSP